MSRKRKRKPSSHPSEYEPPTKRSKQNNNNIPPHQNPSTSIRSPDKCYFHIQTGAEISIELKTELSASTKYYGPISPKSKKSLFLYLLIEPMNLCFCKTYGMEDLDALYEDLTMLFYQRFFVRNNRFYRVSDESRNDDGEGLVFTWRNIDYVIFGSVGGGGRRRSVLSTKEENEKVKGIFELFCGKFRMGSDRSRLMRRFNDGIYHFLCLGVLKNCYFGENDGIISNSVLVEEGISPSVRVEFEENGMKFEILKMIREKERNGAVVKQEKNEKRETVNIESEEDDDNEEDSTSERKRTKKRSAFYTGNGYRRRLKKKLSSFGINKSKEKATPKVQFVNDVNIDNFKLFPEEQKGLKLTIPSPRDLTKKKIDDDIHSFGDNEYLRNDNLFYKDDGTDDDIFGNDCNKGNNRNDGVYLENKSMDDYGDDVLRDLKGEVFNEDSLGSADDVDDYLNLIEKRDDYMDDRDWDKKVRMDIEFFDDNKDDVYDEKENNMMRILRKHGFQVSPRKINLNGNCMFESLSDQIYRNTSYAYKLRSNITKWLGKNENYLLNNGEKLSNFLDRDRFSNWKDYVDKMKISGEWGDVLVLRAFATMNRTNIVIVSDIGKNGTFTIIKPLHLSARSRISLCHYHEYHYLSIEER